MLAKIVFSGNAGQASDAIKRRSVRGEIDESPEYEDEADLMLDEMPCPGDEQDGSVQFNPIKASESIPMRAGTPWAPASHR